MTSPQSPNDCTTWAVAISLGDPDPSTGSEIRGPKPPWIHVAADIVSGTDEDDQGTLNALGGEYEIQDVCPLDASLYHAQLLQ